MVEIADVSYWYKPGVPVLEGVSACIGEGRIYGLLGLNGAGKTTLLKILAGLLFPKAGKVTYAGRETGRRDVETLRDIVLMPSELTLPGESLERFVCLHSVFYPRFDRDTLYGCLDESGIDRKTRDLSRLSLGQKHKFMLSFLISLRPRILLLDEPLSGMDVPSRNVFRRLLVKYLGEDQTAVISTHVMTDLDNIMTDVMVLRNDRSLFCRSMERLSSEYSYGISDSSDGALYAEKCAEGYRVIIRNDSDAESEIPVEILFNAVMEGGVK